MKFYDVMVSSNASFNFRPVRNSIWRCSVQLQSDLASILDTLTSIVTNRTTIYAFCIILLYQNPRLKRRVRPAQGLIRVTYRVVRGSETPRLRNDYSTLSGRPRRT